MNSSIPQNRNKSANSNAVRLQILQEKIGILNKMTENAETRIPRTAILQNQWKSAESNSSLLNGPAILQNQCKSVESNSSLLNSTQSANLNSAEPISLRNGTENAESSIPRHTILRNQPESVNLNIRGDPSELNSTDLTNSNDPTLTEETFPQDQLNLADPVIDSNLEYTPNGIDVIRRTPGGTFDYYELRTLANPFKCNIGNDDGNVELLNEDSNSGGFFRPRVPPDEDSGGFIRSPGLDSTIETPVPPPSITRATRAAVARGAAADFCPISLTFYTRKYVTHSAEFDPNQSFQDADAIACGCQEIDCTTHMRSRRCYYCRAPMNSYCTESGLEACCRNCFRNIHTNGNVSVNVQKKSKAFIVNFANSGTFCRIK